MELIKQLRENGQIQKKAKLEETKMLLESLLEFQIEAEISPSLVDKYPELLGCQYRD